MDKQPQAIVTHQGQYNNLLTWGFPSSGSVTDTLVYYKPLQTTKIKVPCLLTGVQGSPPHILALPKAYLHEYGALSVFNPHILICCIEKAPKNSPLPFGVRTN